MVILPFGIPNYIIYLNFNFLFKFIDAFIFSNIIYIINNIIIINRFSLIIQKVKMILKTLKQDNLEDLFQ